MKHIRGLALGQSSGDIPVMYTVTNFLAMVNDRARTDVLDLAIRRVVRPGDRVIDLGCGFGYLSVIACRAGAAHVDAVDINPAVMLGPRLAAANGLAGRITCHHADGTRVTLQAPADVLISDLRGTLPLAGDHLPVLMAVRDRQLRPGARMVWERDTLWVAPARASKTYREDVLQPAAGAHCDLTPILAHAAAVPYRTTVRREDLLGAAACWGTLDYATMTSADAEAAVELVVDADGMLEALALWFDAELQPGIGFSNAPGTPLQMYRQLLLPIATPMAVRTGDRIRVELRARHTPRGYVWQWRGSDAAGSLLFDHNSLAETVVDASLLPPSPGAPLKPAGRRTDALVWLVDQMRQGLTVEAAARAARERWSGLFGSDLEAERWVQSTAQFLDQLERGIE